jgi:peptide/nickel transport system permease protein
MGCSVRQHPRLLQRFRRKKAAMFGTFVLLAIVLLTIFGEPIAGYAPDKQGDLNSERYLAPSEQHLFGTDKFGRDVFSRVLCGGRISLVIGVAVAFLSVSIGLLYGALSGYAGGIIDAVLMRVLDFIMAFPAVFLVITVVALFDVNHWFLVPVLAFTGWMEPARMVRAEVLSLRRREFVLAAEGLGITTWQVIWRHIIPNSLLPVFVIAAFKVGEVILLESALSFLGLGIQPPEASWGSIISDGRDVLLQGWWIATFPGIFIVIVVMCFNAIGEGLRDTINPFH